MIAPVVVADVGSLGVARKGGRGVVEGKNDRYAKRSA